jgi:hypothetical protein
VRAVLEAAGTDEGSFYYVELDEVATIEVMFGNLKDGCQLDVGGTSPKLWKFLFDLLQAGNWLMLDPQRDPIVGVTTSAGKAKMKKAPPKGYLGQLLVCDSAQELHDALASYPPGWKNGKPPKKAAKKQTAKKATSRKAAKKTKAKKQKAKKAVKKAKRK